jgi:protein ImuB
MPRLASLWLPDLAIDRIRRMERREKRRRSEAFPLDGGGSGGGGFSTHTEFCDRIHPSPPPPHQGEGQRGVKPGHWRPGARWAREAASQEVVSRGAGGALVTAHRQGNCDLLAAICPRARALGLEPGMPLAKARILIPGLDVRPADPAGDAAWLRRLGLFAARRWTPRAALSGPDGLWLDLTGVAHLFGGEQAMCARILAFCRRLGFAARIAVAGTAGAAHALARFGAKPLALCPSGAEGDAIAAMPLAALRLDEAALGTARRLGLERTSLAPRSGAGPGRRAVRSDRARRAAERPAPLPGADRERRGDRRSHRRGRSPPRSDPRRGRSRRPPPRPRLPAGRQ